MLQVPGTVSVGNSAISEAAGGFSSVSAAGPLYTKEGVLKHFEAVLESLELKQQIAELGCGMNSFFTKSRSLMEFTAMCIGLWKLALEQSFPDEAEEFFAEFVKSSSTLGKGKKRGRMVELVNEYNELLAPKKSSDFTAISQHMADNLADASTDRKSLQLKLSLAIRKFYQTIFDHLL
jgi:hypothetical protein